MQRIESETELDEVLTRPRPELIEAVKSLEGPVLILGVGGKMGPSLAVLLRRAAKAVGHPLRIIAASRFSGSIREAAPITSWLQAHGIETVPCDLLDRESVARLPDARELFYLVGLKFGTERHPELTWATNTLAPAHVMERFPQTRIVALSTGNVYPMSMVKGGGSKETDPTTPVGEYANAAVARERIFEYESLKHATRTVLLRLNYAVELRYGVLTDIGTRVRDGRPIDLATGYFNCIWQGDANELVIRSIGLAATPPAVFNLTGLETLSVREVALRFGELLGREPVLTGSESDTALLSNARALSNLLGAPPTPMDQVIRWTAYWLIRGGPTFGKPTHFEVRDGRF